MVIKDICFYPGVTVRNTISFYWCHPSNISAFPFDEAPHAFCLIYFIHDDAINVLVVSEFASHKYSIFLKIFIMWVVTCGVSLAASLVGTILSPGQSFHVSCVPGLVEARRCHPSWNICVTSIKAAALEIGQELLVWLWLVATRSKWLTQGGHAASEPTGYAVTIVTTKI